MSERNTTYNIRNILGYQRANNNEFYTPAEPIQELIKMLKIPKNKIIWCPFDTSESEFVKEFQKNGYKVIYSHLDFNQDFYLYEPSEKWDLIISNPPFTAKRLLIERCESFKKPFCLLYGATIFSQSMGNTLNRCEFYFLQKNIKFILKDGGTKSFQCAWIFSKEFPWK
ncbi:hypothetical protein [Mesoplasma seiffertii]|uniref:hypothetical protein n=1 Tax=Mesoplasma seiffertii TaxID=28224 RepID=UPI0006876245|nr:hypothetical protein [Mesoplasma seiffertii]